MQFRSQLDDIDAKTPARGFCFHVMAHLVQMAPELQGERPQARLAAAQRWGTAPGA